MLVPARLFASVFLSPFVMRPSPLSFATTPLPSAALPSFSSTCLTTLIPTPLALVTCKRSFDFDGVWTYMASRCGGGRLHPPSRGEPKCYYYTTQHGVFKGVGFWFGSTDSDEDSLDGETVHLTTQVYTSSSDHRFFRVFFDQQSSLRC